MILIQEVWSSRLSDLPSPFFQTWREAGFFVVYTLPGNLLNSGNVILSRFPVASATVHTFESVEGWQRLTPNGVLHAALSVSGRSCHVFTTHMQSDTVPHESSLNQHCQKIRRKQRRETKAFMMELVGDKDLWLLAGDFNVEGPSTECDLMNEDLGSTTLMERVGYPPTYNSNSFLAPPGWRHLEKRYCLDHFFTNLPGVEARVLGVEETGDISDHLAVEVVVDSLRLLSDHLTVDVEVVI